MMMMLTAIFMGAAVGVVLGLGALVLFIWFSGRNDA